MNKNQRNWEGRTGGGAFGQKFLLSFLQIADVRILYPVLYLVIPFYLIFGKKGRDASYQYFLERHGFSRLSSLLHVFKNHLSFGKVVLDKFALLSGNKKQFRLINKGNTPIKEQIKHSEGFVIAGAHIGNLELAGLCIPHEQKKVNAIIYGGERADFQKTRDVAFEQSNINLIPVTNDMSHLFAIKEAIERGEIVVIPCDRVFGSPKSIRCKFLGREASFPIGPFRLAAQLEVPVKTLFIMKEKGLDYSVFEGEANHSNQERTTERAEEMACEYVSQLEKIIKQYPDQWFNFFHFWNEDLNTKAHPYSRK